MTIGDILGRSVLRFWLIIMKNIPIMVRCTRYTRLHTNRAFRNTCLHFRYYYTPSALCGGAVSTQCTRRSLSCVHTHEHSMGRCALLTSRFALSTCTGIPSAQSDAAHDKRKKQIILKSRELDSKPTCTFWHDKWTERKAFEREWGEHWTEHGGTF